MAQNVYCMVTHARPHMDEDVAHAILEMFGREEFGISNGIALYEISGTNRLSWDNPEVAALLEQLGVDRTAMPELDADTLREQCGIMFVGTGGGRFDEHPKPGRSRLENVSCVRLVADALAHSIPPQLADLITCTDEEDTRATGRVPLPYDLASLVRVLKKGGGDVYIRGQLLPCLIEARVKLPTDVEPRALYDARRFGRLVVRFLTERFGSDDTPALGDDPLAAMRMLGCDADPALKELKEYLTRLPKRAACKSPKAHSNEGLHLYELATMEAFLPEQMILMFLQSKYEEQHRFYTVLCPEYNRVKDVRTIRLGADGRGQLLKVAFIESEMYNLDVCARHIDKAAVIVIRNPATGHVQILSSRKRLEKRGIGRYNRRLARHSGLDELVKVLRIVERQLAGDATPFHPQFILMDGSVPGAECCWFDPRFPAIFFGSLSVPNAPVTRIAWEELKRLVVLAFSPLMAESCTSTGICDRAACPLSLYPLHLKRCDDLRRSEREREDDRATPAGAMVLDADDLFAAMATGGDA